jgi:hypothetical protein
MNKMPNKKLGNKCLVDTFKIYDGNEDKTEEFKIDSSIFVEMDGLHWDSSEYDSMEEFLQSIINHSYLVAMGKE